MVHPGDSYPDRISRPSTLHAAATLAEPEYRLGNGRIRMPEFGLQLSARRLGLSCRSNAAFAACATSTSAIAGARVPDEVAVALSCADRPAFPPWFQTLNALDFSCWSPIATLTASIVAVSKPLRPSKRHVLTSSHSRNESF